MTLRFYASRGSSALAAHVLLLEAGADFELVEVSIPDGAHRAADYLVRNPKGRIPLLETPEGAISENPAILEYIAARHAPDLVPAGAFAQAQARALCAYLCATAHVAFAHGHRGDRWAEDAASLADMHGKVAANLGDCAAYLETELVRPWARGEAYTFCDPYLFQFTRWAEAAGVEVEEYPRLAAHRAAMRARPATRAALDWHGV